jgi:hypothetical protein
MFCLYLPPVTVGSVIVAAVRVVDAISVVGFIALVGAGALDTTRPKVVRLVRSAKRFGHAVYRAIRK